MPEITLLSHAGKLSREQLAFIPTPLGTATHRPIPHAEVFNALVDHIGASKNRHRRRGVCSPQGWHEHVRRHGNRPGKRLHHFSGKRRQTNAAVRETERASKGSSRLGLKT